MNCVSYRRLCEASPHQIAVLQELMALGNVDDDGTIVPYEGPPMPAPSPMVLATSRASGVPPAVSELPLDADGMPSIFRTVMAQEPLESSDSEDDEPFTDAAEENALDFGLNCEH